MNLPKIAFVLNDLDDTLLVEAMTYKPDMQKRVSARKIAVAACLCLLLALFPLTRLLSVPVSASIGETGETVIVYLGDIRGAADGYTEERAAFLDALAQAEPASLYEAILGLTEPMTPEKLSLLLASYDVSLLRAYFLISGTEERILLPVADGDLDTFTELCRDRIEAEETCFSFVIRAEAKTLAALFQSDNDIFAYIDVRKHPDAEAYAKKKGKTVVYAECPSLPTQTGQEEGIS